MVMERKKVPGGLWEMPKESFRLGRLPCQHRQFIGGGGPIIPGKVYPFVFITIACGAISGFHALVGSGTTPKMINRESDARIIGYGAMLMESFVGVMAFIAAASMYPGDYFAINVPPEKFASLGMSTVNLAEFSRPVGESLAGRTCGAVSLAISGICPTKWSTMILPRLPNCLPRQSRFRPRRPVSPAPAAHRGRRTPPRPEAHTIPPSSPGRSASAGGESAGSRRRSG